ncbi:MAG TPA: SRPBCC family protein [Mycobacteriales bacterium]|nr:SRPBCC family protein [Mycobacteriales bacterium]
MADQASSSITIDADPSAVLDVIRDVEAYPEWTGGIAKAVVVEPGKDGPKKVSFSMSQSGLSDEYTLVYDWQKDGVEWSLAEPSKLQKSQKGSYRLSGSDGRTQVTYLLTMDIKVPMIGLMKRKAEKMIIDSALKELKKRVESRR